MKTVPTETAEARTLVELLASKAEYTSVKQQAYLELKRFARQFRGVMLLVDDLEGLASIDEAAAKVRLEHSALLAKRDALTTEIAGLQASAKNLSGQKADLEQQVDQLSERAAELDRERRQLQPTVETY